MKYLLTIALFFLTGCASQTKNLDVRVSLLENKIESLQQENEAQNAALLRQMDNNVRIMKTLADSEKVGAETLLNSLMRDEITKLVVTDLLVAVGNINNLPVDTISPNFKLYEEHEASHGSATGNQ